MPNFGTLDAAGIRNLVSFRNQASGVLEILDEIREVWSVMADKRYAVGSKASVAEIRGLFSKTEKLLSPLVPVYSRHWNVRADRLHPNAEVTESVYYFVHYSSERRCYGIVHLHLFASARRQRAIIKLMPVAFLEHAIQRVMERRRCLDDALRYVTESILAWRPLLPGLSKAARETGDVGGPWCGFPSVKDDGLFLGEFRSVAGGADQFGWDVERGRPHEVYRKSGTSSAVLLVKTFVSDRLLHDDRADTFTAYSGYRRSAGSSYQRFVDSSIAGCMIGEDLFLKGSELEEARKLIVGMRDLATEQRAKLNESLARRTSSIRDDAARQAA